MEPKQFVKQMMDFGKTAFNKSFESMALLQDQQEKMINTMISQTTFFPEEGKKLITDWMKNYRKACAEFKNAADENYQKVDAFFSKN